MNNTDHKLSGSYYTPYKTICFMRAYLEKEKKYYHSMLEPSAGDGRFIEVFRTQSESLQMKGVELYQDKVDELKKKYESPEVEIICSDFLEYAENTEEKFQLIIGNPPYINKKKMEDKSKERGELLCSQLGLSKGLMQNMWVAFLLASISCLEENGAIFFVLPMEFLQVQYAESIRVYLEEHFNVIHILTFKERMFPDIEQEACLVYLTNERQQEPCIQFEIYSKLDSKEPEYHSEIKKNKPLKKWTNAILLDEDIDLIQCMVSGYKKISGMCDASPGIVTGANHEFILTKDQIQQLNCEEHVLPIVSKSSFLKGEFVLREEVVNRLAENNYAVYLLNLAEADPSLFSVELEEYLKNIGDKTNSDGVKLKDRYKCRNRKPWYGVPIIKNGDLFFFKRYDRIPRICVNASNIYTTDIAYNMRLNPSYEQKSVAFCFYNSLTLAQCEYYGRYYAGGVSELTPSEFKELVIPYYKIEEKDIEKLEELFRTDANVEDITQFVNSRTLEKEWDKNVINRIDAIRCKLMSRRIGR